MRTNRGSALLAVLWLCAGLAAIAFSIATTVRSETSRTSTTVEQTRAYYLASGAVDRAILWFQWGRTFTNPDGSPRYYTPGMPFLRMPFPGGEAVVQVIPESAKMNVNRITPPELSRLLTAMGLNGDAVQEITAAIVDWRNPMAGPGPFDGFYNTIAPTFRARHASFEEIEELLLVKGVTPEMFYGTWRRNPAGRLVQLTGLRDCLSVYGMNSQFDVNSVAPPVLAALGMPPDLIGALIERRTRQPFLKPAELGQAMQLAGPAAGRLRIGGNSIYTLRSTATLLTPNNTVSDVRRSVAAVVKFHFEEKDEMAPYHVLRWYDNAGTN